MKEGDWFGHSEMLEKTVRRNRMVAETKVLVLAIRIHELMECIDEELHELLKCHVFDHQDLQSRMISVGADIKANRFGTDSDFI